MMKGGYVNISVNNNVQQLHYQYDDEAAVYVFDEDIIIGEWTIKNIVKLGGPLCSQYMYDFSNYLELVLTDKDGISKKEQWFYNTDKNLCLYMQNIFMPESFAYFCEKHPIFKCQNWEDYLAYVNIKIIQSIIEENITNQEKFSRIKSQIESH